MLGGSLSLDGEEKILGAVCIWRRAVTRRAGDEEETEADPQDPRSMTTPCA